MSGPIQEYTINYQFEIPAFDFPNWHTYYARTLRTIDALFVLSTGISFMRGPWANGVNYNVGDVVVDMAVATAPNIWQCLVNHTSAATGSFFDDRSTHPSYWQARLSLPQFKGTWVTATNYFVGDFIVSGQQYAVAKLNHLSGATFAGDVAANWTVLVDLGAAIPAINTTTEGTIASAATTDIGSIAASRINVTGTTGITSFGSAVNTFKILRFSGIVAITHNATSLLLPKGATFTTGVGDILHVASDAAGNWRVIAGIKQDGSPAFIATGATANTVAVGNDSRITGALQSTANLGDLGNAATARTNLSVLGVAANLSDVNNATSARNNIGAQAADAQLASNIPQNSQSVNYTTVLTDGEKHIYHPSADNNPRTFTIAANASVAYPIGTTITFINKINTITIAITSDTLILAGAGTTGSRTLAANGMATAIKTAAAEWFISGTGLT